MEEPAEDEVQHVLTLKMNDGAEHARQHGDIDAVRERVVVVLSDVRELHEIVFV